MMQRILLVLLIGLGYSTASGQVYPISNATVSDCSAGFTDTNAGDLVSPSFYGHNEDFTFSICPAGADSIILNFSSFCTELNLDVLTFYDGPNMSAPLIGIPYSGQVTIPTIIATSGCLTVHFESDASVACTGWNASWHSVINIPDNPVFDPISNPSCNTSSLTFTLDQELVCSAVSAANFTMFGPSNQSITTVTPLNCQGGSTNTIQVDFSPGLQANGTYTVQFTTDFLDACDSLWTLTAFGNFSVSDCPVSLEILSPDTLICTGTCTSLEANAWGGDGNYTYSWDNGLPSGAGPHTVCPATTTTYTATVMDGSSAPAGSAQITVVIIPPATLPADFTICQSDPNVDLDAVPNTGYWNGPCFGNDTLAGIFHPGWCGTGTNTIYYVNDGCVDSMEITINPMSVGVTNQLVCPGSPAFNIWTNNPGGTFTGTGITDGALGTFDPVVAGAGVHNITYSNPPCSDRTKIITVGTATIQADDTLCSNSARLTPVFSPKGGTWTGPGVTNWYWCNFDPSTAGAGTHNLIYTYGDCADTLKMTVIEIDAGSDIVVCPEEASFNLTGLPAGGVWSGSGITDAALGTFDPGFNSGNNFSSYVRYMFNGCSDSILIRGIQTSIGVNPLDSFCNYDTDLTLNYTNTTRRPGGGNWSGTGITNSNANGTFSPSIAGAGLHTLYYSVNTCVDSTLVMVYPDPLLQDTAICIEQSAFNIPSAVAGGVWSGNGIVNPNAGTFLASLAGLGTHNITYITPDDCYYSMQVTVDSLAEVSIGGLPDSWCFADSSFPLIGNPFGGIWSGASSDSIVNPIDIGSGVHTISYTIGAGECAVSSSRSIQVSDTLKVIPLYTDTTVCSGTYVRMNASAVGGNFLNYSFAWDDSLGSSAALVFQADSSSSYTVRLNDGCSQEATATININIHPDFTLQIDTSNAVCYGENAWMKVVPSPNGNYTYEWQHDAAVTADSIQGAAGQFYSVEVTDTNSGCTKEFGAVLPAFDQLVADFLTVPNDECVDLLHPEFYFIDQSIGGAQGSWTFGDGDSVAYQALTNIYHTYEDTGVYEVTLHLINEGGCIAQKVLSVCVLPKTLIIAPTAFSPNGDGVNDVFLVRTIGAINPTLSVYDRWGVKVYETNDLEQSWDGLYKGKSLEVGTYTWQVSYYSLEKQDNKVSAGLIELIR